MALNRTNLKQTPIPVVPRTMQIVNADGTVTRSGQLLLQQLQASEALQGTHGGRPAPGDAPDGALYVESDRLVLYSNIDGAWHYIAGTMWGTINPDQRPTDLGVNDAGFDFRTVDQPAREFIWSQAYWVEVTPVRYGTHAARLAVDVTRVIEQMLWVETDRSVLYQLMQVSGTTPVWQYIAGTMWGTLSPDQRPTDLGTHDAGFDYRGTDQQREFIWSQAAWVEVTPVTGALNLTNPNVVTKVGSISGQIVEGGITDMSAANSGSLYITAAGNVGIGTTSAAYPLQVVGTAACGVLYIPTSSVGPAFDTNTRIWSLGGFGTHYDGYNHSFWGGSPGAELLRLTAAGGILVPLLPSFNPGAGSKALWYDPSDGNRVKYAP